MYWYGCSGVTASLSKKKSPEEDNSEEKPLPIQEYDATAGLNFNAQFCCTPGSRKARCATVKTVNISPRQPEAPTPHMIIVGLGHNPTWRRTYRSKIIKYPLWGT